MKYIKSLLVLLLVLIYGFNLYSQQVEIIIKKKQQTRWASKVVYCSSEYSKQEKSANQILGKPNVLPRGGESPCAWAVKKQGKDESPARANIIVEYDTAMIIQQVAIAESFNPGAVEQVIAYGMAGVKGHEKKVIYTATPQAVSQKSRMLNIFIPPTEFPVKFIELVIQPGQVLGWNEIDAIGIADDVKDTIKAQINTIPTLKFEYPAENLGPSINTTYDELAPIISPDGKMLFFTRKFHPENFGGVDDEDDIWYSEQIDSLNWKKAKNIGAPLNNKDHNFVQSITPDGNTLLLANIYNEDGTMSAGVSISNATLNGWSFPIPQTIDKFQNINKSANYFLAADGKTLLMAIETKNNNYGNLDLYVSFRKSENKWTEPKNLGPIINTTMNDYSPFLAADGVTLYYSTEGHSGYGKEDIFITRRLDDTWTNWTEPQNLGSAINTPESDSKYTIPASGMYAYYSSTNNSRGKNDIFRILLGTVIKPKPVVLVYGKVLNERNMKPVDAKITYEILPEGEEAGVARSNPNTGEFKIVLPAGKKYGFLALAKGYYSVSQNLDVSNISEYTEVEQNLYLAPLEVGQVFRINNIFFEFNSANLTPESFPELNRLAKFLEENPKVKVEIAGHTDDRGSDAYNLKLSKDRAQSVCNYLVLNGISANRFIVKGFGKTKPVAFNTTEEGRQMNRRVEFTILEK